MKTVLLKLSGEALLGQQNYGIDNNVVDSISDEIKQVRDKVRVAVVIGGGNIFRGIEVTNAIKIVRASADSMGMLATVINSIALKDRFITSSLQTQVLCSFAIEGMFERFERDKAIRILDRGNVLILAGGTSNPYFTTDSASVLRALEIDASIVLKGTNVDGVYDKDPKKYTDAKMYKDLTFKEAMDKNLKVMDMTAFAMANDNNMPIRVFDMHKKGNISKALLGNELGTYVHK